MEPVRLKDYLEVLGWMARVASLILVVRFAVWSLGVLGF